MKYKELEDTVANLRAFADWLETNPRAVELPALALSAYNGVHEYGNVVREDGTVSSETDYSKVDEYKTRTKMRAIAKAMSHRTLTVDSLVKKDYSGGTFALSKEFGSEYGSKIRVTWTTRRDTICRKVVTGKKFIPAETKTIPARTEEEVEWVCDDSLLASN
jgi:hypothetical protein